MTRISKSDVYSHAISHGDKTEESSRKKGTKKSNRDKGSHKHKSKSEEDDIIAGKIEQEVDGGVDDTRFLNADGDDGIGDVGDGNHGEVNEEDVDKKKRKGDKKSSKKRKKLRLQEEEQVTASGSENIYSHHSTLSEIDTDKQIVVLRALQSKAFVSFCAVTKLLRALTSKRQSLFGLRVMASRLIDRLNSNEGCGNRKDDVFCGDILTKVRDSPLGVFKNLLQIQSVPATVDSFRLSSTQPRSFPAPGAGVGVGGSQYATAPNESRVGISVGKASRHGLSLGGQHANKSSIKGSERGETTNGGASAMPGRAHDTQQKGILTTNIACYSN
jgi:hypothetical protein